MKLFNGDASELRCKHDIFIGISVGIKPMSEDVAFNYIRWALDHTRSRVLILIADEIAKYNYRAFSHYTKIGCVNRARRDGEKYIFFFQNVLDRFSEDERSRIAVVTWKDIITDHFEETYQRLVKYHESNPEFSSLIGSFIAKCIERRKKNLSEERVGFLEKYILSELPTLLEGVTHGPHTYRLLLYPTYFHSGLCELVTDIFQGIAFAELKDILVLRQKTVLVEAYINEAKPLTRADSPLFWTRRLNMSQPLKVDVR